MKVFIDGQECSNLPEGLGAPDILTEVRALALKDGRVVTEIRVDDVAMDEDAFLNITGGLQVRFVSQSVRELVRESLEEALNYIPRLLRGLEEIALHFEGNESARAQGKLADAAEGLDWLLSVFQNSSSLMTFTRMTEDTGLDRLKDALTGSINLLGVLYEEKKYLQMALCIRQRLLPEISDLAVHIRGLRDLANPTQ